MKKLKDILYDYNDILIALAIMVIAALLIMWRISAIVDYPREFISDNTEVSEPAGENGENEESGESGDPAGDPSEPAGEEGEGDEPADDPADEPADEPTDEPAEESSSLWEGGVLTRDVQVSVSGGSSATDAIQRLIDAGLFKDYAEYQAICDELGLNHQMVGAGIFVFDKGSTKTDVARVINWSRA